MARTPPRSSAPRGSGGRPEGGRSGRADGLGRPKSRAGNPLDPNRPVRDARPTKGVASPRNRSGDNRVGSPDKDAKGLGGEQVEGRQAVRELLRAGRRRTREIWIVEDIDHAPIVSEIEKLAAKHKVPVRYVPRGKLEREARTDAPQGIVAKAAPLPEADLDELINARAAKGKLGPFLLLLDGVTDPHNLGALLRSAEYAGVTGAVLPRHRAAHVTPTVAKSAAGAVEHVPISVVAGLPAALLRLGERGVWRIGLDQDATADLYDLDLGDQPVALVLGAEGEGLGRLTRARCDAIVAIPRGGRIDSLNVSVAGAVACFEVARRRAAALARSTAPAGD